MSSDPIQYGEVTASYFWDTGTSINGDTGAPASGKPMQKGMAASPSWPMGTEGYVEYNGKKAEFFVGDRGPGDPAENCDVLLDLDGKTFAELTGSSWNEGSRTVDGGQGHIDIEYYVTKWGDGSGAGAPEPMSGSETCDGEAVQPVPASAKEDGGEEQQKESEQQASDESGGDGGQSEQSSDGSEEEQAAESTDEDQQSAAGSGGGDQGGSGKGLTAETAANDVSGISLAGDDLPLAAGVLTLAILPALLVAFLFARRRRTVDYAAEGGRHRAESLMTAEGLRETVQSARERFPGSWSEAKATAGDYWQRATDAARSARERRNGRHQDE